MNLRICDNGNERIVPASLELVEGTFAPATVLAEGTEITIADGDRWLAAIVVGARSDPGEFLLSGDVGESEPVAGRVARGEALRQFRRFLGQGEGRG